MPNETLTDFISGRTVPNVGAEANRQAVERFLVESKGYRRTDIRVDFEATIQVTGSPYLARVDLLRLDHFRGFASYWELDGTADTAEEGRWIPGPGRPLFDALAEALGGLPLLAEDLGLITPDVIALRDELDLPGMQVLQFLLTGDEPDALARIPDNSVVYTGTHDNDTTAGWFA